MIPSLITTDVLLLFLGQEVVVEGQDKVFKDVIEPLESVSVNLIPTSKTDIRDFGPPQQVCKLLFTMIFINVYGQRNTFYCIPFLLIFLMHSFLFSFFYCG